MDVILIPGFWLDGSSWDEVVPALEQAGHHAHPLTLPGMQAKTPTAPGSPCATTWTRSSR
jgi:hypothetical protein